MTVTQAIGLAVMFSVVAFVVGAMTEHRVTILLGWPLRQFDRHEIVVTVEGDISSRWRMDALVRLADSAPTGIQSFDRLTAEGFPSVVIFAAKSDALGPGALGIRAKAIVSGDVEGERRHWGTT